MTPVKPGWITSEWWTTLAAHVIAIVALVHPNFVAPQWTAAFAALAAEIGAGFYSYSRGTVKAAAVTPPASPAPVPAASTATDVANALRQVAAALTPTPPAA